jgi:hypothetical protein
MFLLGDEEVGGMKAILFLSSYIFCVWGGDSIDSVVENNGFKSPHAVQAREREIYKQVEC